MFYFSSFIPPLLLFPHRVEDAIDVFCGVSSGDLVRIYRDIKDARLIEADDVLDAFADLEVLSVADGFVLLIFNLYAK